jgi:hypothetical protein
MSTFEVHGKLITCGMQAEAAHHSLGVGFHRFSLVSTSLRVYAHMLRLHAFAEPCNVVRHLRIRNEAEQDPNRVACHNC